MRVLAVVAAVMADSMSLIGAPETWTGQIGDSMCGARHMAMRGRNMPDRECTEMCVKNGSKYIFVVKDKVYQIANQKDAALATHAGHTVVLTGEMKGATVTVTKIEMPKK